MWLYWDRSIHVVTITSLVTITSSTITSLVDWKSIVCSRETLVCSRKSIVCSRETLVCSRETLVCSRKSIVCSRVLHKVKTVLP
ncbi:hypothetical protein FHG87_017620 [Trinorchestia longiramus]|nr:hypothetical protein FHG87_017620 [Trinorchestia longiramus]